MIKVLIKRLNQKVKIPSYKTIGSSGVDLEAFLENPIEIGPNKSALIPTGLAIAIPEDTEVQIRPRSGLAAKSSIGVLNSPGTIDSDYRGEIKIILFNHGNEKFLVNNGDRIAQMVLMPVLKFEFEETKDLPDTLRGFRWIWINWKKMNLKTKELERYSRQIIIKDIGISGQKKIKNSKVLIVGLGGLGCPVAEYLCRSGVGTIGLIDHDKIDLSNIHRQSMFTTKDVGKFKVKVVSDRVKKINPNVKIESYKKKLNQSNVENLIRNFDIVVDGTDNFTSKFLVNEFSRKLKKIFVCGAISKFDGHIFSFNFSKDKRLCLKSFYQTIPNDEVLNCEADGVVGTIASVVGSIQANEVIKNIVGIGKSLNGKVLIINLLNLDFRVSNLKKIR